MQWLANTRAHPPGYVENHLPESERLDPTLPEKYNNLVIKQVEILCKAVVQISKCENIFQKLKLNVNTGLN
jgi:hypothetical protein